MSVSSTLLVTTRVHLATGVPLGRTTSGEMPTTKLHGDRRNSGTVDQPRIGGSTRSWLGRITAASPGRQTSPLLALAAGGALLGAVLVAASVATFIGDSLGARFSALVAFLATMIPALVLLDYRRTRDALSPLLLTGVFYWLAFVAGPIFYWFNPVTAQQTAAQWVLPFTRHDLTTAVAVAALGWVALSLGYILRPFRAITPRVPALGRLRGDDVGAFLSLYVLGWIARGEQAASGRYFHTQAEGQVTSTGTSALVYVIGLFPTLVLAYVGSTRALTTKRRRLLLLALSLADIAWYLPSGGRGEIVQVLLVLLVTYYYRVGHLPWRPLAAAGCVLVFVLFPLAFSYRGYNHSYQAAPRENLTRAAGETFSASPAEFLTRGVGTTASRFNDVTSLATIVRPDSYKFRFPAGGTFGLLAASFVPRIVQPDKVNVGTVGNEFGRAYGLLAPSDYITSLAITQPGEFYIQGGASVVALGMLVVGSLYGAFSDFLIARRHEPTVCAVYAVAAWPFVNGQESIIALGLIGVAKFVAVMLLAVLLARAVVRAFARSAAVTDASG